MMTPLRAQRTTIVALTRDLLAFASSIPGELATSSLLYEFFPFFLISQEISD
jgi:hypothetical protein